MSSIVFSEYRTNFFLQLIVLDEKIYQLHDVKKIKVHHNKNNTSMEISPSDLDDKDDGFLKTAQLSGSSLHTNKLYQGLRKLGHYITEITWTVEDTKNDKIIEINAGFQNPKDCTRFFYDIKGIYKKNIKGTTYTSERHKILDTEKIIFLKFFDNFIYKTYDDIIEDYENQLVVKDE